MAEKDARAPRDLNELPENSPLNGQIPGKLMIAGEYAILRREHACVAVALGEVVRWRLAPLDAPKVIALDAFGRKQKQALSDLHGDRLWDLIRGALQHLATLGLRLDRGLYLELGGTIDGQKVGLGGSAAVTIALQRAVLRCHNLHAEPSWLLTQGHAIHAASQGGKGSGYDIATIAHGGCLAWRRDQAEVTPLPWPPDLHGAALFSGTSADTSAALTRGVGLDDAGMDAISAAADRLRRAWESGEDAATLLDTLRDCEAAFSSLAHRHPHLRTAGMRALTEIIEEAGAVARTSGAGAGDCMLALSDDPARIERVVLKWRQRAGHCVARLPQDLAPPQERP